MVLGRSTNAVKMDIKKINNVLVTTSSRCCGLSLVSSHISYMGRVGE